MASVTINFTAANAARLRDAMAETRSLKDKNGDPRPATVADLKEYIIEDLKQLVLNSERRVAARASEPADRVEIT